MSQSFSRSALAKYIASSDKPQSVIAEEVAAFLIDSSKTSDLDSLMRDVVEERAESKGIVEVTVTSAFPISKDVKSEIDSLVHGRYPKMKRVIIHEVIDTSIIGGVRLQFANASLDLTVQTKLHKLRESIA